MKNVVMVSIIVINIVIIIIVVTAIIIAINLIFLFKKLHLEFDLFNHKSSNLLFQSQY